MVPFFWIEFRFGASSPLVAFLVGSASVQMSDPSGTLAKDLFWIAAVYSNISISFPSFVTRLTMSPLLFKRFATSTTKNPRGPILVPKENTFNGVVAVSSIFHSPTSTSLSVLLYISTQSLPVGAKISFNTIPDWLAWTLFGISKNKRTNMATIIAKEYTQRRAQVNIGWA